MTYTMYDFPKQLARFIREELYPGCDTVGLHEPTFVGNEQKYVVDAIDSTFVSSVGLYVDRFEKMVASYTGARRAVAVVNGTAALHAALHLLGVGRDDLVITQPLTFVATANAICYCGADPVFVDVDNDTAGLSPSAVARFLEAECRLDENLGTVHKTSNRRVAACVPMHTFGLPMRIRELVDVCERWAIPLVEDAAESLGSHVGSKHVGRFGRLGVLSFNGNKTITTGGGGMIITDDPEIGRRAKHVTTTAKVPHRWEFVHDDLGFNYRLPNINAALGCAQMEQLDIKLRAKAEIRHRYQEFLAKRADEPRRYQLISATPGTISNYWLNAIRCSSRIDRDEILGVLNDNEIMARPVWELLYRLPMYKAAISDSCPMAEALSDTVVNVPSWPTRNSETL